MQYIAEEAVSALPPHTADGCVFGSSSSSFLVAQSAKFREFLVVAIEESGHLVDIGFHSIAVRPATLERVLTMIR